VGRKRIYGTDAERQAAYRARRDGPATPTDSRRLGKYAILIAAELDAAVEYIVALEKVQTHTYPRDGSDPILYLPDKPTRAARDAFMEAHIERLARVAVGLDATDEEYEAELDAQLAEMP
jgi:hypothetical protein